MKKVLLFIIISAWAVDSHAIKLCKKGCSARSALDAWGNASGTIGSMTDAGIAWTLNVTSSPTGTVNGQGGCFSSDLSATGSGGFCWCRITSVNTGSGTDSQCANDWLYTDQYYSSCMTPCSIACGTCAQADSLPGFCSRKTLFTVPTTSTVSAVTCPTSGTCSTNSNYKTIGDNESCGVGYEETTGPALTISGSYSNANGTFTYNCTAN